MSRFEPVPEITVQLVVLRGIISSKFPSDSEAKASESLGNLEEIVEK